MLGAEVEHLLSFRDAADVRPGQAAACQRQRERADFHRVLGDAQFDERAVDVEQTHVVVELQVRRDRVQDQVEAAAQLREGVAVGGGVVVAGARRSPSSIFFSDCDSTLTSAPIAAPSLTPCGRGRRGR